MGDEEKLRRLLQLAKGGDVEASTAIVESYRAFVERLASDAMVAALNGRLSSQDIAQDTMVEAWRGLPGFRGGSDRELRAWFSALVRNKLVDAQRRHMGTLKRDVGQEVRLHDIQPPESPERSPSSHARAIETDAELWAAVNQLSPSDRRLLELRYRDRLSHSEIAKKLTKTETAVRKQWSRVLAQLESKLGGS